MLNYQNLAFDSLPTRHSSGATLYEPGQSYSASKKSFYETSDLNANSKRPDPPKLTLQPMVSQDSGFYGNNSYDLSSITPVSNSNCFVSPPVPPLSATSNSSFNGFFSCPSPAASLNDRYSPASLSEWSAAAENYHSSLNSRCNKRSSAPNSTRPFPNLASPSDDFDHHFQSPNGLVQCSLGSLEELENEDDFEDGNMSDKGLVSLSSLSSPSTNPLSRSSSPSLMHSPAINLSFQSYYQAGPAYGNTNANESRPTKPTTGLSLSLPVDPELSFSVGSTPATPHPSSNTNTYTSHNTHYTPTSNQSTNQVIYSNGTTANKIGLYKESNSYNHNLGPSQKSANYHSSTSAAGGYNLSRKINRSPSQDDEKRHNVHSGSATPSNSNGTTCHQSQAFKCRQLPCRTFISTGSCPYGDRCVFLHDPAIASKQVYIKTKRKSKEDSVTDTFFWPTMSLNSVMGKLDGKQMPHIHQPYIVPAPYSYFQINSNNDNAVFSMWEHFLDFCKTDSLSIVTVPRTVATTNPFSANNPYTGKKRLPILVHLSQSI